MCAEHFKIFPTYQITRRKFYGIYNRSPKATVIQSTRKRHTSFGCIFKPISVHVQPIFIGSEQSAPCCITHFFLSETILVDYVFFWVFPRRLIVVCRRFGNLYRFHLQGLDVKPEKHPKEYIIFHYFILSHVVCFIFSAVFPQFCRAREALLYRTFRFNKILPQNKTYILLQRHVKRIVVMNTPYLVTRSIVVWFAVGTHFVILYFCRTVYIFVHLISAIGTHQLDNNLPVNVLKKYGQQPQKLAMFLSLHSSRQFCCV